MQTEWRSFDVIKEERNKSIIKKQSMLMTSSNTGILVQCHVRLLTSFHCIIPVLFHYEVRLSLSLSLSRVRHEEKAHVRSFRTGRAGERMCLPLLSTVYCLLFIQ